MRGNDAGSKGARTSPATRCQPIRRHSDPRAADPARPDPQQLAELIGVTYQQAHKYEKDINRVAAGRLYEVARVLGVDPGYFYEGVQSGGGVVPSPSQRMLLDLARNILNIPNPRHRDAVARFARALAEGENGDDPGA
jgi:transcriptional regulator with XRE-family HTH domain